MKRVVLVVAIAALAPVGAAAEDFHQSCIKSGDERIIEVVAPGEKGEACDVRHSRADGGDASVPYYADNSPDYCNVKAAELAETLKIAGYECSPVSEGDIEARADAEPALHQSAAAESPPAETAQSQPTDAPANIVAAAKAPQAAPAGDDPLEDRMRAILAPAEQPIVAAVRGPAQLSPGAEIIPASDTPASPVGRLVGVAPETSSPRTRPVMSVASAGLATVNPPPAPEPAATAEAASVTAPPPAAETQARPGALRKPEEVIRATLEAQAAAWNEGNLDAFMETYWKSDDLKFVSGTEVTKGWSSTMKRYRDRYADAKGLGWLGFDKLEVTMATSDVAVVTGRFNHAKADAATSGTFSLVMRRQNGVWRIVHDHTSPDPKPTQ